MTSDDAGSDPLYAELLPDSPGDPSRIVEGAAFEVDVDYSAVKGRTAPRIWTRPLRPLTRDTTYGYRFVDWCAARGYPLDPWERWLAVHVGELLPDGRPRFRRVLIIVARQNGKTLFVKLLILWWAYEDSQAMILMTAQTLDYARIHWSEAAEMAGAMVTMPRGVRRLAGPLPTPAIRQANGQEMLVVPPRWTHADECADDCQEPACRTTGGTFRIAASKEESGGRSQSLNRLVMDEVRHQKEWGAYNAGMHAMNAVDDAQALLISNQGDREAVVLREVRATALKGRDRRVGLFEWSAPPDSAPDDLAALAQANPNLGLRSAGRRIDPETLLGEAWTAMDAGGEALTKFMTEVMCIDVPTLRPAINPEHWRACAGSPGLGSLRGRIAACLDVAPNGEHATLAVAAVDANGMVRVELVRVWDTTAALRRSLPLVVARVKPRVFGWFPNGPAAAVATELAAPKKRRSVAWPPPGVEVRDIRTEVPAVCMGLEELTRAGGLLHPQDEVLNMQIGDARQAKLANGTWVFDRGEGGGPIDAVYAVAGAVHMARLLPQAPPARRLVVAK
jgi:hypothetical protein